MSTALLPSISTDDQRVKEMISRSSYLVELIPDDEYPVDCYASIHSDAATCADQASVWVHAPDLFKGRRPFCSAHEHLCHAEWMVGV